MNSQSLILIKYFPPAFNSIISKDRKGNKTDIRNYDSKKNELLD